MRSTLWASPAQESDNPSTVGIPTRLIRTVSLVLVAALAASGLAVINAAAASADDTACVTATGEPAADCGIGTALVIEEPGAEPIEIADDSAAAPAARVAAAPVVEAAPAAAQAPAPTSSGSPAPTSSGSPAPTPSGTATPPPGGESPDAPVIVLDQECVAPGATTSATVRLSGLTAGHDYTVRIDGATGGTPYHADSATGSVTVALAAGTHRVTVSDDADPYLRATEEVYVEECLVPPTISLTPQACTTPQGSATITAVFGDLAEGHLYSVTVSRGGSQLGAVRTVDSTSGPLVLSGLPAGSNYSIEIVDQADSTLRAVAEQFLASCPTNPVITIGAVACMDSSTNSTVDVELSSLVAAETYTVRLAPTAPDAAIPAVTKTITGVTGGTVTFSDVVPLVPYTVTVSNASGYLSASTTVTAEECGGELPEVVEPPVTPQDPPGGQLPTLALGGSLVTTGSDPMWPLISALSFLGLGAVLLTVTAARRRKEVGR